MQKHVLVVATIATLTVSLTALAQKAPSSAPTWPVTVSKDTLEEHLARMDTARAKEKNRFRYIGISVKTHPSAKGEFLKAQQRFAMMLERRDYIPAHRVEHFHHLTGNGQQTITGWVAGIVYAAPVAGGLDVVVKVWPRFADGGFFTSAHTIERYHFSNTGLQHISTEGAKVPSISVWN